MYRVLSAPISILLRLPNLSTNCIFPRGLRATFVAVAIPTDDVSRMSTGIVRRKVEVRTVDTRLIDGIEFRLSRTKQHELKVWASREIQSDSMPFKAMQYTARGGAL